MLEFDVVIVGAGVSGMVSSMIMAQKIDKKILLIDEYNEIGGNHISENIGEYTFDIGSFFFQDDSPLLEYFPSLLPKYKEIGRYSILRLTPNGAVVNYPIDLKQEIIYRGPVEWTRILISLLFSRLRRDPSHDAANYVLFRIGKRLAEQTGLLHYLRRFYGTDPHRIESIFVKKRMGWVERYSSVKGAIELLRQKSAPTQNNKELVRPREGFNALYSVAQSDLENRGVSIALGNKINKIEKISNGRMIIHTDKETYITNEIISTIPVNTMTEICGLPHNEKIKGSRLISLFYSLDGHKKANANVIYNFSNEGSWKRMTFHSDFYGLVNNRMYFSVEVVSGDEKMSVDDASKEFIQHAMSKNGVLSGDIKLEGARITENAYPVYLSGATEAAAEAVANLRNFGILTFGRQGGFDYQPTARISALEAKRKLASL